MFGYNKSLYSKGIEATSDMHLGIYLELILDGTSIVIREYLIYVLNKGVSIDIGLVMIEFSVGIEPGTWTNLKRVSTPNGYEPQAGTNPKWVLIHDGYEPNGYEPQTCGNPKQVHVLPTTVTLPKWVHPPKTYPPLTGCNLFRYPPRTDIIPKRVLRDPPRVPNPNG